MKFLSQLRRRTPLGWLQLSQEKSRLLVALSGIAFADILMFMQLGFMNALYDSNTRYSRALDADIILLSPQARNSQSLSTFSRRRLYQAADVPGVTSASGIYIGVLSWRNPQTLRNTTIQITGFNPAEPPVNLPQVMSQLDKITIPDQVLFDRRARGQYQEVLATLDRGESVTTEIEGRTITIAGVFELGSSFGADGNVFTSSENFLRLFPRREAGSISLGLIKIEPGLDPQQVANQLNEHLTDDVQILTLEQFVEFEKSFWSRQSPIGFIFSFGTAMAFVVGLVIVYQVLSTDVNAHLQEYATFRAMGYQQRYLLGIVFEEALILGLLGFIPGVILPIGIYHLAAQATALPIQMTWSRVILVLVLTQVMCNVSGAIATRKLQAADPADLF